MADSGRWMVTPEAVLIDLPTASLGSRLPARALDLAVCALGVGLLVVVVAVSQPSATVDSIVAAFASLAAYFGYAAVMEAAWRGRTLGKAALGLRVVTAEGAPIGFRQALIRSVLSPIDLVLGVPAVLVSSRDQRLGDVVAGTVVVRERDGANAPVALYFPVPVGFEQLAATFDVRRVSERQYDLARAFVRRRAELSAASRLAVATRVASGLAAQLGHGPLWWVEAEVYVACVVAACQHHRNGWALPAPAAAARPWSYAGR